MQKNKNILSSLLLASTLTLTPVLATSQTINSQLTQNSLSNTIAKNLHRRGIDKEASKKIASKLFTIDEELFAIMLKNLQTNYPLLSKDEILQFLTTQALISKSANLNSYSYLVNMIHQIKSKTPNQQELALLKAIAVKNNNLYSSHSYNYKQLLI